MLQKINAFLIKSFGLKIVRAAENKVLTPIDQPGNNLIIEFLGAPGVGKTTFCNYYFKNHQLKTDKEILSRKHLNRLNSEQLELSGVHDKILDLKINHDAQMRDITAISKLKSIMNFKVFVEHDFMIHNYLSDKLVILDEERLLIYYLNEDNSLNDQERQEYFENRIFVYCDNTPQNIVRNIKTRAKTGKLLERHKNLNDAQLIEQTEQRKKIVEQRITDLKSKGARFVILDMEQAMDENAGVLDEILSKALN